MQLLYKLLLFITYISTKHIIRIITITQLSIIITYQLTTSQLVYLMQILEYKSATFYLTISKLFFLHESKRINQNFCNNSLLLKIAQKTPIKTITHASSTSCLESSHAQLPSISIDRRVQIQQSPRASEAASTIIPQPLIDPTVSLAMRTDSSFQFYLRISRQTITSSF